MTTEGASEANAESGRTVVLLAVWFGLLTGLLEVLLRVVQRYGLHQQTGVGPEVVWMAPLADVVLFGAVGGLLVVTRRWIPGAARPGTLLFVFTALMFAGPLLAYPRLHPVAAVALAAGVAVQGARLGVRRWPTVLAAGRRSTVWLVLLVIVAGASVPAGRAVRERRILSALPQASSDAPNVLLLILDTVRSANLGLHGYSRPTSPNLERLAARGVVFDRAISTAPWTLPSHASMFTGRFPHELGSADWLTPLDSRYQTLAETLSKHGYRTGGFVANLLYCTYEQGLNRGFSHYEDYPVSVGMVVKSSWLPRLLADYVRSELRYSRRLDYKNADDVNQELLAWLDRDSSQESRRPFFAFLNYFDAHEPYWAPQPWGGRFGASPRIAPLSPARFTSAELQADIDRYDAAVAYVDAQVGSLLDGLEARGLTNTIVIAVSDHGEQFGEHGLLSHGNSLYLPLLHVPLIISYPRRVPSGTRISTPVSLADLPRTALDIAGLASADEMPGHSLAGLWSGTGSARPPLSEVSRLIRMSARLPASRGPMQSLMVGDLHYIRGGDGQEELYDLKADPGERVNLAVTNSSEPRVAQLRAHLAEALGTTATQSRQPEGLP